MKIIKIVLLVTIGLVLSACGDRLVFVTKTSVGVDVGLNGADNGIHIGFKRFEGVVDPLKGCANEACTKGKKAQSLLAKLNFGLSQEKQNDNNSANVAQWFATGKAATILAGKDAVAIALTGKDIKLSTSFQQGIDLSQLSLWGTIYDILKESGKYDEIISSTDKKSKIILSAMFKKEKESIDNNATYPFPKLMGYYRNCNTHGNNCRLKDNKKITELTEKIDQALEKSMIEMLELLNELLTKEK